MSAGNAGAAIGLANTVKNGPIGGYVQSALNPRCENNYIGASCKPSFPYNAIGEAVGFTCKGTGGAATGKTLQWVKSASVLVATDKVTLAAGVATKDNDTGTHTVFGSAAVDEYMWVSEI